MHLPRTCILNKCLLGCCREHLVEAQKRANIDQEAASELFKRWASSKVSCPAPSADDWQASADSEVFCLATCRLAQLLQLNSKLQA